MNEETVQTVSLTKRFGNFIAVDKVNLSISRGEIFGFLGPNGSGKTTTIRMLCGLLSPSGGNGSILGMDIALKGEKIRGQIGYMSQKFSLYSDLTVMENLRFYAGMYGLGKKETTSRIQDLIGSSRLEGCENELTSSLSAGIRQRLALSCSILHEPAILFLDEPTSGVDPAGRRNFWKIIYALAEKGTTIMVTTHFMDEAEHCDRLGLMYAGQLLACDSPQNLKKALPGHLFSIRTDDPVTLLENINWEIKETIDAYLYGRSLRILSTLERPAIPEEMKPEKIIPSLEDVFVHYVREGRKRNNNAARGRRLR